MVIQTPQTPRVYLTDLGDDGPVPSGQTLHKTEDLDTWSPHSIVRRNRLREETSARPRQTGERDDIERGVWSCATCIFLRAGTSFSGTQKVQSYTRSGTKRSAWKVLVCIQGVDLSRATICGSMRATDVPEASSPVKTFWEGEIIDNQHFFFRTGRWDSTLYSDLEHWGKFEAYSEILSGGKQCTNDLWDVSRSRFIFMRWKEKFFVDAGSDVGLTIAGFYYICLDRQTGLLQGYYFDPKSSPFQKLELIPTDKGHAGFTSPHYSFT
mmetsp:Transcript_15904/g.31893  ORF Transcript_15904/g.31893 Transcript_15904/m.31893 type:complete len:267 (-) Transcript_15904:2117-2917(-)